VRLDRGLLRGPRPRLGQPPVLERDGPAGQGEAIHGHVERPRDRARGLDEVGEVEIAGRQPDDPYRRAGDDQVADPDAAAHERGEVKAGLQAIEVGKRRRLVTLGEVEATYRQAPGQQIELNGFDADRPTCGRTDPGDRDPADNGRQFVHCGSGATDQDDSEE